MSRVSRVSMRSFAYSKKRPQKLSKINQENNDQEESDFFFQGRERSQSIDTNDRFSMSPTKSPRQTLTGSNGENPRIGKFKGHHGSFGG